MNEFIFLFLVISTYNEPVSGWINNDYGPTKFVLKIMLGMLRVLNLNPYLIFHIVPGDYTINALIVSAWDVAQQKTK